MRFQLRLPFSIKSGEVGLVVPLVLLYFLLGLNYVFTQTAAYALFIDTYEVKNLPYAFIGIAIWLTSLGLIYLFLIERLVLTKMLWLIMGFLLAMSILLRVGLLLTNAKPIIFFLPIWELTAINLSNTLVWTLAARVLNVRQSKRLFSLILSGRWIGVTVGGFMIVPLVALLGTENLLVVGAISLLVAGFLYRYIISRFRLMLGEDAVFEFKSARTTTELTKEAFLLMIFGIIVVWTIAYFFTNKIFYTEAALQYQSADELAGFLGIFAAAVGLLTLASNLILVPSVLERGGLRVSLLLVPIILLVIYLAYSIGATLGASAILLFWLATLGRSANIGLSLSFDTATFRVLFQPLPTTLRAKASAAAETIIEPLATGLAGILLIFLSDVLYISNTRLGFALAVLFGMWILFALMILRHYPQMLIEALRRSRLGESEFDFTAEVSQVILEDGMHSPYPDAVIYAASLLENMSIRAFGSALPILLKHPEPEVQKYTLERIRELYLVDAIPRIRFLLAQEPVPKVHEACLRTLISIGGTSVFEEFRPLLDTAPLNIRRGILAGLIHSGSMESILFVGEKLATLSASDDVEDRILAANLLGEMEIQNLYEPLLNLLNDPSVKVQEAALVASGSARHPKLADRVIEFINQPTLRRSAMQALANVGVASLQEIAQGFNQGQYNPTMQICLARVCGRIKEPAVRQLLEEWIDCSNYEVRTEVYRALKQHLYTAPTSVHEKVLKQLRLELDAATWMMTAYFDIGDNSQDQLVLDALYNEWQQTRERVIYLIGFLGYVDIDLPVWDALITFNPARHAYALEIIETRLAPEVKRLVFPLLEVQTIEQGKSYDALRANFPQERRTRENRFQEIIRGASPSVSSWTRVFARYSLNSQKDDLMQTIEKVLILKTVDLFSEIPGNVLAEIAQLLEEIEIPAGQVIFNKGEYGDSMYIVISGKMRVHDGDNFLNYMGARSAFGEMALLDSEPRVASVTAEEDTRLFRLNQTPFYELMADYPQLTRGIIRVLTGHLRSRVKDLTQLQKQMKPVGEKEA